MENELRDRLMKYHNEVLEVALMLHDFPLAIDEETAKDIAEFMNASLYDQDV